MSSFVHLSDGGSSAAADDDEYVCSCSSTMSQQWKNWRRAASNRKEGSRAIRN